MMRCQFDSPDFITCGLGSACSGLHVNCPTAARGNRLTNTLTSSETFFLVQSYGANVPPESGCGPRYVAEGKWVRAGAKLGLHGDASRVFAQSVARTA
eukprot:1654477-Heterocapsa_arctica.AAC.1